MTADLDPRLAALEAAGWALVHKRPGVTLGAPDNPTEVGGNYRFERRWRNGPVNEYGESLIAAIEAAERQQERIEGLPNRSVHVREGLVPAGRNR
jgi:hypothetical protein